MYQKKLEADIRCPLEYGLSIFGGKWESRILCVLADKGTLRYKEIRAALGNITDSVLTLVLKKLTADELVHRVSYEETPPRVEYSLSAKGLSIIPILQQICSWSSQYFKATHEQQPTFCQSCLNIKVPQIEEFDKDFEL